MSIELVTDASPELVDAFARLIPQLSSSAQPLGYDGIDQLLDQPDVYLFIARDEPDYTTAGPEVDTTQPGQILGMLTLVTFHIPTGMRGWIEDVVVDETARGKGLGRALIEESVAFAKEIGCKTVDLTSRPSREAANRLYQSCGFEKRETNVYRH
ncbi:GNAT family N-acetyltransferase [Boudabousia marimammalium]|uniref:GNAT family N-acetyltransferase n=1 Tax=Boudabousia marimammalium TaxID=156892 RepID=A0A1Q5PMK8_9ACTO|nr:GNAT family N-acetyltransferase [Boudabousia marimammalium]OKL48715.1 GNAT family N-acetyltransferase [Boudabousia marimammalium]